MRIDNILEAAAECCPTSSCAIYQKQSPTVGQSATQAASLTYQSATRIVKQHREIIQTNINNYDSGKPADVVVAILAHNSIDFLLALLACMNLPQALPVLLNTRWTHQEISQALQSQNHCDRTMLVYDTQEHAARLQQAAVLLRNNHRHVSRMRLAMVSISYQTPLDVSTERSREQHPHNLHKTLPTQYLGANANNQQNSMDATAVILFTSGTTSGSKGVLLSHRALYVQALAKLRPPCGYDRQTQMLATTVPLFHVGGLSSALAVILAGGSLVFPPPSAVETGFQPTQVLRSLHYGPRISTNTLVVVPAMLSALMEECRRIQTAAKRKSVATYSSVRLILIGGQSATTPLLHLLYQRFPNARVVQTYACTEGASSLTFWERHHSFQDFMSRTQPLENHAHPSGIHHHQQQQMGDCVGLPPGHVELRLFRTNTDNQCSTNGRDSPPSGVIATRGPHLFTGYWKRGSKNSDTQSSDNASSSLYACHIPLTPDGWFVTNDLGFQDEQGRYYFSGRVADVIRTGGETVLATEVERVLLRNDKIQECAVFSLPDPKFGETVCAALVVSTSISVPSLQDVRQWCAEQGLAGYKCPRRIFVLTELPRNSSGKLLKRVLVDRFRGETDGASTIINPRMDPAMGAHPYHSKL